MIKEYEAGVNWLISIGQSSSTKNRIRVMRPCASGYANWRMSVAGSGIAVWVFCLPERDLK